MKKKLLLVLLSAFTFNALAETPTFNYFDLGYITWRPDQTSLVNSLSGLNIKFSKEINESVYFAGDLEYVSKNSIDITLITAGVGYASHFSDSSSVYGEIDIANVSASGSSSETGYEATVGVRSMVSDALELKGAIEYLDINGGDTTFALGTAYLFTENFGAYFDYKFNQDVDRFALGIRYSF